MNTYVNVSSAKHIVSILSLLVLSGLSSHASAAFATYSDESLWRNAVGGDFNVESFESFSVGEQISSLPALGVRFDELAGSGLPAIYKHAADTTPYGRNHLGNFPNGVGGTNRFDDIVLRPLPGFELRALGYWNGDGQADTFVASAYDEFGNKLGDVGAFKSQFAGFVSMVPVARVVFDGNTGDGWNHLDGLQTSPVPLPPALYVLSVALGCLALLGWRRKQS